jgi:radical SAM enzyme (TIGR01210 family)
MNIQKRTIVERMFRHREYRPPWLWSLVDLIRRVHPVINPNGTEAVTRLLVHPTAAGKIRGAHNCGNCDRRVAAAIERYSVSADLGEFEGLACECEARWRCECELDLALPIPLGCGLDRRGDVVAALLSP